MDDSERLAVRDLVAALDQAEAALTDVARTLGRYRLELIAAGFDGEDALELCLDLQRSMILDRLGDE